MEKWLPWFSLATSILSLSLVAVCVGVCSRLASRCTRALKRRPPSESILNQLAVDQAGLSSALQSMATTVKRLSSRHGMQDLRSRQVASEPPPPGASKSEIRKFYGFTQDGPEFARRQLQLVPKE